MFENFTYKQKLIGVGVIFILLFFTANKRSFKVTRNSYTQMKEVASRLDYMKGISHNSRQLQEQISFYDKILGAQNIEPEAVQQSILDFATKSQDVRIDNLTETHISKSDGFSVITNQLVLEGDFHALTNAVYEFEKKFNLSSLVSVQFFKEKNYNNKNLKLRVLLIFQNYEKSI